MAESSPHSAGDAGFFAHVRETMASLVAYMRARLRLLTIESREAAWHFLKIALALVLALVFAGFGYLFLLLAIVFAISRLFANPNAWIWVSLVVALGHFVIVAICAAFACAQFRQPMFRATLEEFRKDEEWLTKN